MSSIILCALHGSGGNLQEQACCDGRSLLQSSNASHVLSYVRCLTAAEQFGTNRVAQGPRKGVTLVQPVFSPTPWQWPQTALHAAPSQPSIQGALAKLCPALHLRCSVSCLIDALKQGKYLSEWLPLNNFRLNAIPGLL